ncbi:MAG: phenylalanine--tRNA ligase subunit beta [Thermodesulfobacteriota bacterium]|nr:MAG: phenylalanine--tRNA ligase subunit beta [Thermodesulfobacteriota bacterium]
MLYSYNWLKEYVHDLPSPGDLSELLTMSGCEVDSVTDLSAGIKGVVTAVVEGIEPHPNADKLKLCRVRAGKNVYSIICGAANMKEGDGVALALDGAVLPGGVKIKRVKIRGVQSEGMMCSEAELGLKDSSEGILILPGHTPTGRDILKVLGLDDYIIEVSVTPNRGDVLSIRGLAREIAAVTGKKFTDKKIKVKEKGPETRSIVQVSVKPHSGCERYAARVIEGVKVGESPDFIKRRLEALGMRPVNNVVDVTNYVLIETGQPLHAFDLDRVSGRSITVRGANSGETIETIDNKVRKLGEHMVVIADGAGPVALGGVMGGKSSEVTGETANILLESACFEPAPIRRASRELAISTDSSYRFERGTDIENVTGALDMAAALISEVAAGVVARGAIDIYPKKQKTRKIKFSLERAEAVLGLPLKKGEVRGIFKRLGIMAEDAGRELECTPPSFRHDIKEEADLVEEVARISGYGNVPIVLPVSEIRGGGLPPSAALKRRIREALRADGFLEVMNYSFVSYSTFSLSGGADPGVRLLNPLSEDQSFMRDSLVPSLLDNLKYNIDMKNGDARIFEVAPVFLPGEKLPVEKWKTSGLIYGKRWRESWNFPSEDVDFYDIKGVVEKMLGCLGLNADFSALLPDGEHKNLFHPGKSSAIKVNAQVLGVTGEAHPDLIDRLGLKRPAYLFELDLDAMAGAGMAEKKFTPLPRYPASERDIAFILDSAITYGEIIKAVEKIDTKLVEKVDLFDVYYGRGVPEGKRSLAIRIRYRSAEKTLIQEDVEKIHSTVASELASRFGAEIRGIEGAPK